MTPEDIALLWRIKGGHKLARIAARPDTAIPYEVQSQHGGTLAGVWFDTKRDGIHVTEDDKHHVITWAAIRAHVREHTPEDVRALICDIDWEWCRVKTGTPGFPPERAVTCERWLVGLARIVWDPELVTPATPQPEQLDMLAYLEEMTA